MTLLPIVLRELKAAAGRRHLHVLRVLGAGLGVAMLSWLFLVDTTGGLSLDGRRLLQLLAWTALVFCLVAGGLTTANAISRERREGTLGLLFLTDLRGKDVVWGKLTVASLPLLGGVLGFLPLLTFSFLLGGVSPIDVLLIAVVLANTLFLALSLGLFVSALGRNESRTLTAAVLLPLGIAFGPYILGQLLFGAEDREPFTQLPAWLLAPSPAFALGLVHEDLGAVFKVREFIRSLVVMHLAAWGFLSAAAMCVLRLVRESTPPPWMGRIQDWVRDWVFGSGPARAERRARLLAVNPLVWLASRHRHKSSYLWVFVLSMGVIAVGSGAQTHGIWFEWKPALGFLLIMHAAMKLCFISEACHRLGMDRQQGGFELILTTPTDVATLARGHALGLRRTFAGPLMALAALDVAWLWLDWIRPEPDHDRWVMPWLMGVIWMVFLLDCLALRWMSLWQMLFANTATRAAQACFLRVQVLPVLVWLGISVPMDWVGRNTVGAKGREAVVVALLAFFWLAIHSLNAVWWRHWCRQLFLSRCRIVAAEGLEGSRAGVLDALSGVFQAVRQGWREPLRWEFWRRHPWLGAGVGCALVCLGALGVKQAALHRQLTVELQSLRPLGVPLTAEEVARWQPKVSDPSNAVVQFRLALERLSVSPGVRVEPVLLPGRLSAITPRMRAGYAELLRTNESAIAAAKAAMERSASWFDPEAQFAFVPGRFRGSLPLRLSGLMLGQVALEIENGNIDAACSGILEIVAFAEFMGNQPRCSGQNVRHAALHQAMDALERLLARHALSPAQLDRVRSALLAAHDRPAMRRALEGELWLLTDAWEDQRFTLSSFSQAPLQRPDLPESIRLAVGRLGGVIAREFIAVLATARRSIAVLDMSGTERVVAAQQLRDTNGPAGYFYADAPQWIQNLGGTVVGHTVCLARLRAALFALDLERARGTAEIDLVAAADGRTRALAQPTLAEDPFTGHRLRLVRRDRGFAVVSEGTHGEDMTWVNRFTGRDTDDPIRFVVDR